MTNLLGLDSDRLVGWLFARCVQESIDQPSLREVAARLAPRSCAWFANGPAGPVRRKAWSSIGHASAPGPPSDASDSADHGRTRHQPTAGHPRRQPRPCEHRNPTKTLSDSQRSAGRRRPHQPPHQPTRMTPQAPRRRQEHPPDHRARYANLRTRRQARRRPGGRGYCSLALAEAGILGGTLRAVRYASNPGGRSSSGSSPRLATCA
jgi:hypothetical protein